MSYTISYVLHNKYYNRGHLSGSESNIRQCITAMYGCPHGLKIPSGIPKKTHYNCPTLGSEPSSADCDGRDSRPVFMAISRFTEKSCLSNDCVN